jgi:hypothetical protein
MISGVRETRANKGQAPRGCPARATRPGVTQSGCPWKRQHREKNANVVQPTDRRIPPLPWPPNSGSRSISPRLQSWENAPRAAVPREDARREKPSQGLPNRDARVHHYIRCSIPGFFKYRTPNAEAFPRCWEEGFFSEAVLLSFGSGSPDLQKRL